MSEISLFTTPFWTVTSLTLYLRDLLESDEFLQDIWVQGEISNLSRPTSGHLYFTLKDNRSALRCVIWRSAVSRLNYPLREGQAVEVHGRISIYESAGQYQLYADTIRPAGEGILYQEFLRLKSQLEAEGLFAPERKRPIPKWPHRIGIVTSPTGAAIQDILNTLRRRYPLAQVILSPTAVQGEEAPQGIVTAIKLLNEEIQPDVIILARGGGSIEDLWAFNDERVARAIAASTTPIICGVGHETDFTIADFTSDLRAPTPTAAAELATPNMVDLKADVDGLNMRLRRATQSKIDSLHWNLRTLKNRHLLRSPLTRLHSDRQRLDEMAHRFNIAMQHFLHVRSLHLISLQQRLASLSPQSILQRGYAIVSHSDGRLIRSVHQVQAGDGLNVCLQDGQFEAQVTSNP